MVRCRLIRGTQPLRHRLRDATARVAAPCFRRWRRSSPLLLPRGGLGIPQSFASSPEAPLPGELSAKQTERLYEGQPDRETSAGLNLSVIAYAMPPPLPRGGLGIPQSFASSPEAPLPGELSAKQTERLDQGQPDRKPLTFGHNETGDAVCLYIICPMTAA